MLRLSLVVLLLAGSLAAQQPPSATVATTTPQRGGRTPQRGSSQGGGFRNLNVNQTADNDVLAQMGAGQTDGAMNGAMGDNASEAFSINGTLSGGLQNAQAQD